MPSGLRSKRWRDFKAYGQFGAAQRLCVDPAIVVAGGFIHRPAAWHHDRVAAQGVGIAFHASEIDRGFFVIAFCCSGLVTDRLGCSIGLASEFLAGLLDLAENVKSNRKASYAALSMPRSASLR